MAIPAQQVRDYLAALPPGARRRMKEIRAIVKSVAPKATETFSYRIPGFRLDEKVFVYARDPERFERSERSERSI
jgi:uncharacterized protein YdhG (YjbR/CyaY superfamily)